LKFPDWAHNVGVSGNSQGHLFGNQIIVSYGAPVDFNPQHQHECTPETRGNYRGYWDLAYNIITRRTSASEFNPADYIPVYLFVDKNSDKDTFFHETSYSETIQIPNLVYVGFRFYLDRGPQQPQTAPIYSCYREKHDQYFLSNTSDCRDPKLNPMGRLAPEKLLGHTMSYAKSQDHKLWRRMVYTDKTSFEFYVAKRRYSPKDLNLGNVLPVQVDY